MKFIEFAEWYSNTSCSLCTVVDKLYNDAIRYYDSGLDSLAQSKLIQLDNKNYIVNGYGLLPILERYNYQNNKEKIRSISKYISNDSDKNSLINSRWCSRCGYRKPNIIDKSGDTI